MTNGALAQGALRNGMVAGFSGPVAGLVEESARGARQCFDAVTSNSARILGLADYGLEVGKAADFVLLQAGDAIEAIRLRATRLLVVRRGQVLACSAPAKAVMSLPGRPIAVDWRAPPR